MGDPPHILRVNLFVKDREEVGLIPGPYLIRMEVGATYYNTVGLFGSDLEKATKQVGKQERYVLNIFKANPDGLTSDEVYQSIRETKKAVLIKEVKDLIRSHTSPEKIIDHIDKQNRMIISIRRSITNLMNDGHLIKTGQKRMSLSGRKNHVYVHR